MWNFKLKKKSWRSFLICNILTKSAVNFCLHLIPIKKKWKAPCERNVENVLKKMHLNAKSPRPWNLMFRFVFSMSVTASCAKSSPRFSNCFLRHAMNFSYVKAWRWSSVKTWRVNSSWKPLTEITFFFMKLRLFYPPRNFNFLITKKFVNKKLKNESLRFEDFRDK